MLAEASLHGYRLAWYSEISASSKPVPLEYACDTGTERHVGMLHKTSMLNLMNDSSLIASYLLGISSRGLATLSAGLPFGYLLFLQPKVPPSGKNLKLACHLSVLWDANAGSTLIHH